MFSSLEPRKLLLRPQIVHSLSESHHSSTKSDPIEPDSYIGRINRFYMSAQLDSLKKLFRNRIINHTCFWLTVVLTSAYHGSLFGGSLYDNLINMVILLPPQMIAAYTLVYYQVPRLLFQGKSLQFAIHLIGVAYVTSILARVSVIYIVEPLIGREGIDESLWEIISDPLYLITVYTILVYLPVIILFLIKMTSEKFKQEKQVQLLQTEKRDMELNFLKAQMNPHFLFNTMNNLYALAKSGASETPDMIMKLSELLDYTIYDCQEDKVSLAKEWELIENYADLQAMRFKEPLNIVLEPNIENEEVLIAPLILISFVENAFKFAIQTTEPHVCIKLLSDKSKLHLHILNTRSENQKDSGNSDFRKKIGAKNVVAQLDLLYPDSYTLSVDERHNEYEVNLQLYL